MKLLLLLKPLITKVKEIAEKLGLIADYVVEEGTSGNWTYRKCNSGIAECWGYFVYANYSIKCTTAYGSIYYCNEKIYINLPFKIIDSDTTASVSVSIAGSGIDFATSIVMDSNRVGFTWANPMPYEVYGPPRVRVAVKGRWK